nr:MAG TPA: hypothetical protein [Caudoviricetes sp.]
MHEISALILFIMYIVRYHFEWYTLYIGGVICHTTKNKKNTQ